MPDGGGYQVCGLYDANRIVAQNNVVTLSNNFGDQTRNLQWRRPQREHAPARRRGAAGGHQHRPSHHEQLLRRRLAAADRSTARSTPPFQTQVKLLGVYPWPWWGIQTSATMQSLPGPEITAAGRTRALRSCGSLGRNLTAGNATVPLIEPGTMYGGRLNQVDFRLSKVFRFGAGTRVHGQRRPVQYVQREPDRSP